MCTALLSLDINWSFAKAIKLLQSFRNNLRIRKTKRVLKVKQWKKSI